MYRCAVRPPCAGDLPPQVFYVLVDKIEVRQVIRIITPKMCGNGLTGQHPVLIDDEIKQQVELLTGSFQRDIADARFESIRVQRDLVELYHMRPPQVLTPVHSTDPRMQLCKMKRLGKVVIGAVLHHAALQDEKAW